jgi:hypothetical protein
VRTACLVRIPPFIRPDFVQNGHEADDQSSVAMVIVTVGHSVGLSSTTGSCNNKDQDDVRTIRLLKSLLSSVKIAEELK